MRATKVLLHPPIIPSVLTPPDQRPSGGPRPLENYSNKGVKQLSWFVWSSCLLFTSLFLYLHFNKITYVLSNESSLVYITWSKLLPGQLFMTLRTGHRTYRTIAYNSESNQTETELIHHGMNQTVLKLNPNRNWVLEPFSRSCLTYH